uniref:Uncharacterized protein n=1 Tax=Gouania willdenowi TaxID=441366 RepID=A0A8C5DLR1_GOUWI
MYFCVLFKYLFLIVSAHTQSQTPNSLQCFFCASPTRCDVSTPCTGDETLCIQGTCESCDNC